MGGLSLSLEDTAMPNFTGEPITLPKVVTLPICDFPIVEGKVGNYKVLELPRELRNYFDEGADIVRITSLKVARSIPDYGGTTSGTYSLPPHQDHFGDLTDPREYLMLTKHNDGSRGASTIAFYPTLAKRIVLLEENYFKARCESIRAENLQYDPLYSISKRQFNECFEKDGYDAVVRQMLRPSASRLEETSLRLNILGYLVRDRHADELMRIVMRRWRSHMFSERWERGGVLIIRNPNVFHGRFGGNNPPLQRNFCI